MSYEIIKKDGKYLLPDITIPNQKLVIEYNDTLLSNNQYLIPSFREVYKEGKMKNIPVMIESQKSKDLKEKLVNVYKRALLDQPWDINKTEKGFVKVRCDFVLKSKADDPNNFWKILCDSFKDIIILDDKNLKTDIGSLYYDSVNPKTIMTIYHDDQVGLLNIEKYEIFKLLYNNSTKAKLNKADIVDFLDGRRKEELVNKFKSLLPILREELKDETASRLMNPEISNNDDLAYCFKLRSYADGFREEEFDL